MKKSKEFELFRAAAAEAARIDGQELLCADRTEGEAPVSERERKRFEAGLRSAESGKRSRMEWRPGSWVRTAAAAACAVAVMLLLPAMTEAGRYWLSDLVVNRSRDQAEISLNDTQREDYGQYVSYVPSRVPIEYRLEDVKESDGRFDLRYENREGKWFEFCMLRGQSSGAPEVSGSSILAAVPINDTMAFLTESEGIRTIRWSNETTSFTVAGNAPKDLLIEVSRSVLPVGRGVTRYYLNNVPEDFIMKNYLSYPSSDVVLDITYSRGSEHFRFTHYEPTATVIVDARPYSAAKKVDINGVEGKLIISEETTVIWSPDDAILVISGNIGAGELIEIARNVEDQHGNK